MKPGHPNHNETELSGQLATCAYCGSNILKGAMRCVSCGKILKTPEEQSNAIRQMVKDQNRFRFRKLFKLIVFFIVSGAVYYYYADGIREFISILSGR
jgi:DNA-directed RNA polymerase subunit RPC12/RpoP